MMNGPLLEMTGIRKCFPGVVALDDVSLTVAAGEVVALCGENGAGKSTLMKILGGVYAPDAGVIRVAGTPVRIQHVTEALRLGVAFIHQELNVLENLDVAANVFLGREPRQRVTGLIDRRKLAAATVPLLQRLGLEIAPDSMVGKLSIAQRQMVEIAKALSLNARLIIMDEPTSSLTVTETDRLLALVRELSRQGVSVIYISHRLGEVAQCAQRVVVLRDGKNAGELAQAEITHDRIVSLMVGRELSNFYTTNQAPKTPGYFRVRQVKTRAYPHERVSFDATRGEILGLAGLVGAGRSELAEAIFGVDEGCGGEVFIGDERVPVAGCKEAIRQGIYLVPEDRRGTGLVTAMSVRANVTLASVRRYAAWGLIRRAAEATVAERQSAELAIKTPTVETPVESLSGGNQQKVVLGKWLSMQPRVIFFDEPTRGIDVGAKAEIYRLMRELVGRGVVVIMISSDMEEILNVSDRVAVMHEGRITGVLERPDCTEANIMNLAVGRDVAAGKPSAD
ncbi:MAG: Xylose import ATP-binding protein XylG [Verrucomicrobiae bacterium]|nr:Xylose import ATP-binding protein XylG [Verrucomicrobiae bacterium]